MVTPFCLPVSENEELEFGFEFDSNSPPFNFSIQIIFKPVHLLKRVILKRKIQPLLRLT